ncbi:MAG: substrate-binding domain-containing protein [Bacillota bacterium]
MRKLLEIGVILVLVIGVGLFAGPGIQAESIRLATTTSTEDSGLLDELLPIFTEETGIEVDVIAVGTGQALEIGRRGDADVVMVHAPDLEKEFVEEGYGTERTYIMYNDFVIVGPTEDPANISDLAEDNQGVEVAMEQIYEAGNSEGLRFLSRGDDSGTHQKELELWEAAGIDDVTESDWYDSLGQGMGSTLITANEMAGYALTDRGTYLSMAEEIANLKILYEGDDALNNPYGIIPLNPEVFENVNHEAAQKLVDFMVSDDIQELIGEFGTEKFGQPLFFPDAD